MALADYRRYFPDGSWSRRVQPMPEYGCIYVRNAKAACTSTLLWLQRLHAGDPEISLDNIHGEHTLPRVGDIGGHAVARMLDGEAFRFSFVRDPAARIESAYRDKIVRQTHPRERRTQIQRTLGLREDPNEVPTFDEFLAAVEVQLQEPRGMDVHWRPQHINLMHPLVEYDLIGRVESFNADLARVAEAIGAPTVSVRAQNRTERTESFFDGRPGLVRKVRAMYAADFELYGY